MLNIFLEKLKSDLLELDTGVKEKHEQTVNARGKAYSLDLTIFGMADEAKLAACQVISDIFFWEGAILSFVTKGTGYIRRVLRIQPWESIKNICDFESADRDYYGTSGMFKRLFKNAKEIKNELSEESNKLLNKLEKIYYVYQAVNERYENDEEVHPDKIYSIECYYENESFKSNIIDEIIEVGTLMYMIGKEITIDNKLPRGMKFSVYRLQEASKRLEKNIPHVHNANNKILENINGYLK